LSYRILVVPGRDVISLPVLQKIKTLVAAGATVILPRPEKASGLAGFPRNDAAVQRLAGQLFGESKSAGPLERPFENGRVISGRTAREVLLADGIKPDFECAGNNPETEIDYFHRRDGAAEIYFVASRGKQPEALQATFRVSGKAPELWDAVSGEHRFADAYAENGGRTTLPLDLAPCGSMFVVFRAPASSHPARSTSNSPRFTTVQELSGPWTVAFDPKWGGPASATFAQLTSWTTRTEPGIEFYSGTAVYRKSFDLPPELANQSLWLDLGNVRELAEVKVNGRSCGITWSPPFRVDLSRAVKPGANQLEVEVVNFWPNRVIGDDTLPPAQRLTRTNVRKLTRQTPLMESGLFGPVKLVEKQKGDS
jgi:hypothetical protein